MSYEDASLRRAAEIQADQDRARAAAAKASADEAWKRAGLLHRAKAAEMANRILGIHTTPEMWRLYDYDAKDIGEFTPRMVWAARIKIEGVEVSLHSHIGALYAGSQILRTRADFVAVLARTKR